MYTFHDCLVVSYLIIAGAVLLGLAISLIVSELYKHRINLARKVNESPTGYLKHMMKNFRRDVINASTPVDEFVKKEMSISKCNDGLYRWARFSKLLSAMVLLFVLIATSYMAVYYVTMDVFFAYGEEMEDLTVFVVTGLVSFVTLFFMKKLSFIEEKESCLELVLVNYFNNQLAEKRIDESGESIEKNVALDKIASPNRNVVLDKTAAPDRNIALDRTTALNNIAAQDKDIVLDSHNISKEVSDNETETLVEDYCEQKIPDKQEISNEVAETSKEPQSFLSGLNKTLSQATQTKTFSKEDEKLIEDVLKEYLFR